MDNFPFLLLLLLLSLPLDSTLSSFCTPTNYSYPPDCTPQVLPKSQRESATKPTSIGGEGDGEGEGGGGGLTNINKHDEGLPCTYVAEWYWPQSQEYLDVRIHAADLPGHDKRRQEDQERNDDERTRRKR